LPCLWAWQRRARPLSLPLGRGPEGPADGPIISICGTNTGWATSTLGDGPLYIDAAQHPTTAPVLATPGSAPIAVIVSKSCAVGAKVTDSDPGVISLQNSFRAKDGAVVATYASPVGLGQATLTAIQPGAQPITVTFTIVTPGGWCQARGIQCPSSPTEPSASGG
jgi:hypothetical protein